MYERVARKWVLERSEQNERRAGGVHYRYELALDPEIVLETRESIETRP
jgi:hypothetical protein